VMKWYSRKYARLAIV